MEPTPSADDRQNKVYIHPQSISKLSLDTLNLLLLIYCGVEIPYSLAFESNAFRVCAWTPIAVVNLFVDTVFMVDIVVTFFTAIYNLEHFVLSKSKGLSHDIAHDANLLTGFRDIAKHYLMGWFVFDVVSSLPFDRIMCSILNSQLSSLGAFKILRLLKLLRLVKIARIARLLRLSLRRYTANPRWTYGQVAHRGLHLTIFVCVIWYWVHLCACIWYGSIAANNCRIPLDEPVAAYAICGCEGDECHDWNWLVKFAGGPAGFEQNFANSTNYILSFYFAAVTLTTIGYGDVTASNSLEQLVVAMLAVLGALLYSWLISSIGSLFAQNNLFEMQIQEKLDRFDDMCHMKVIPTECVAAAKAQVSYSVYQAPQIICEDIRSLPRAMQNDMLHIISRQMVEDLCKQELYGKWLGEYLRSLDSHSLARLVMVLRPCTFAEDQYLFKAGELATEFYLITEGSVHVEDNVKDERLPATELNLITKGSVHVEDNAKDERLPATELNLITKGSVHVEGNVKDERLPATELNLITEGSVHVEDKVKDEKLLLFRTGGQDVNKPVKAGAFLGQMELFQDVIRREYKRQEKDMFRPGYKRQTKREKKAAFRPDGPLARVCSALATSQCHALELSQEDLIGVVRPFLPELYETLEKIAEVQARTVNWVNYVERQAGVVENRKSHLAKFVTKYNSELNPHLDSSRSFGDPAPC